MHFVLLHRTHGEKSLTIPSIVEMLRSLVGTPSVSNLSKELDHSNRGVIDHLANWLEDLGFTLELIPLPDQKKFNLVARKGEGEGGLLLSGHSDTVPCDPHLWQTDPFELTTREDRYYGLGTCDMKGFFPVVLESVAQFSLADLRKPLTVLVTADEETTMAGARQLLATHPLDADAAVIGEPTSLQPIFAHKGIFTMAISFESKGGHSSNPTISQNALEVMCEVMGELVQFRNHIQDKHHHNDFEIPYPTINLGCLRAGDSANRICSSAELLIDCRILPGMSNTEVIEGIQDRIDEVEERLNAPIQIRLGLPPIDPFESTSSSRLLRRVEKISGRKGGTVAFATEAPFLQQMGIDTVVFGPGSIDQAHQTNEFLHQGQIQPAIDSICQLIGEYCGRS